MTHFTPVNKYKSFLYYLFCNFENYCYFFTFSSGTCGTPNNEEIKLNYRYWLLCWGLSDTNIRLNSPERKGLVSVLHILSGLCNSSVDKARLFDASPALLLALFPFAISTPSFKEKSWMVLTTNMLWMNWAQCTWSLSKPTIAPSLTLYHRARREGAVKNGISWNE